MRGDVQRYVAQANPKIDAARAEKNPFRIETSYKINKNWLVEGDIFNLLNAKADDITYYYTSRLPGEPAAGVSDFMSHAAEPRTFRVALTMRF